MHKKYQKPIDHPENSIWVNIFAPTEFLTAMQIYPLFIEAYSSFMSGFLIEDYLIDRAENPQGSQIHFVATIRHS